MPKLQMTPELDKSRHDVLRRPRWWRKLVRYFVSTMGGITAETILLWVLSDFVWPDWEFGISVIAPTLGFELCLLVNYGMVRYFVWRERQPSLWRFHVSNVSVYVVKMIFLLSIRYSVGIDIIWCNFLAMAIAGLINFVLNDRVVFRKREEAA